MTTFKLSRLLCVGALACACAASPKPRPETAARVSDTAPDKAAAMRAASGDLRLQESEDRFAIEAARERKRRVDQEKTQAAENRPGALGPVDVRQPPAAPTPAPPAPPTP
jgi:hypothetical protein